MQPKPRQLCGERAHSNVLHHGLCSSGSRSYVGAPIWGLADVLVPVWQWRDYGALPGTGRLAGAAGGPIALGAGRPPAVRAGQSTVGAIGGAQTGGLRWQRNVAAAGRFAAGRGCTPRRAATGPLVARATTCRTDAERQWRT
eukprot:4921002-Prymnesium_polylepis.1